MRINNKTALSNSSSGDVFRKTRTNNNHSHYGLSTVNRRFFIIFIFSIDYQCNYWEKLLIIGSVLTAVFSLQTKAGSIEH